MFTLDFDIDGFPEFYVADATLPPLTGLVAPTITLALTTVLALDPALDGVRAAPTRIAPHSLPTESAVVSTTGRAPRCVDRGVVSAPKRRLAQSYML